MSLFNEDYNRGCGGIKDKMKRSLDLLVSITFLFIIFPLCIILMLLIRYNLGSPVFFVQKRPGLHGRLFNIFKFRTMTNHVDSSGNLLPDELRLTKFGVFLRRFSLDELPQFINVIKGEMTLVGPRPMLPDFLTLYTLEQSRRHNVKPGITGWAQVNGRNAISWEEKLAFDVWYVDNKTFWLDLKILWMTVLKVVKAEGVKQPGNANISGVIE